MNLLITTLSTFIEFYSYLLIIRVLLTWFGNIDWSRQPFAALSQISDPYLNLFRSIIPPFSGIDFSPMLAFLVLNLAGQFLVALSSLPFVQRF